MDIFPHTTERAETAVDQVGRTDRQMTYFLSSRAIQYVQINQTYMKRNKIKFGFVT